MPDEIKKDDVVENKDLIDEIAALDSIEGESLDVPAEENTDDSKTVKEEDKDETVKDDKESANKSKEKSDAKETKKETEVDTEEKKDEEVSAEEKSEETSDEDKQEISQVDRLLTEVERLSGLVKSTDIAPASDAEKKDRDEKKSVETVAEDVVFDYLKDLDMDDVSSDPGVLNKILHAVAAKVQQQTTEQVLLSIPQVVMSQVQQQTYFKRMADKFYDDNKDLVNVRHVVRACAQQIQQANPEWEVDKVFSKAAEKARETLGMSAYVVKTDENITSVEDAAFAKAKGGSKTNLRPKRSSLQMEIDEL